MYTNGPQPVGNKSALNRGGGVSCDGSHFSTSSKAKYRSIREL
jgi:hypothetical protein